jgi:hypothetical protein
MLAAPAAEASRSVVPVSLPLRPVKEYLKTLRANSCYAALRTIINVSFGLCVIGCLLAGVGTIVSEPTLTTEQMVAIPATLLAILLLVAARQAVFVVIDIADALIHEANKNFRR